jgi:hypothetical protein
MNITSVDSTTAALVRSRLLELARRQDELAAAEATATPYWNPQPTSVHAHRAAAAALRAEADQISAVDRTQSQPASAGDLYPRAA